MNAAAAIVAAETAPARFVDNADGTITDTRTGLMWSKATNTAKNVTHKKAEKVCAELDLAGHADWRLPTVEELLLLADRSKVRPAIDTDAFPDTHNDWYWSSTAHASGSSYAWVVDFYNGSSNDLHRAYDDAFVRAVRAVRSLPAGQ